MKYRFPILLGCFLLISFWDVSAQQFSVKPGLVRMENEEFGFGVDFETGYEKEYTITSETGYPRIFQIDLKANGTLLTKPEFNPKHQHVDVFLGYLVSFKKAQEIQLGQEPEPSKDYGSLGLGFTANFEANQPFTELNLEQGLEVRYINTSQQYLPVFEISYLFVMPLRSEFRDVLNEDTSFFQRFESRAFWTIRFRQFLLNPDFRYFRSLDLSPLLEEIGLREGLHSSISLGYVLNDSNSGPLQFLKYIYLQYNYGQYPVYLDNREAIEAGVMFRF